MRTPFAIKGGGHTTNPGFSSTSGVQIAMVRFNTVTVDQAASTVAVGAKLLWDDVYKEAFDGAGLNVVSGRVPGIGVPALRLVEVGISLPSWPYLRLLIGAQKGVHGRRASLGLRLIRLSHTNWFSKVEQFEM